MLLYPIDTNVPALKTGFVSDYESTTVQFAVFTEEHARKAAENHAEVAETLTGWYRYYRGPGRPSPTNLSPGSSGRRSSSPRSSAMTSEGHAFRAREGPKTGCLAIRVVLCKRRDTRGRTET